MQLEGQLVESRLATAEAQVDPQMLFSALAEIRDGFSRSLPDADAKARPAGTALAHRTGSHRRGRGGLDKS